MSTTRVSTCIPAGLAPSTVLRALHNHDLMIRTLCPALISYTFVCGNPKTQATYLIQDKKPGGMTTYHLTLTPTPTGVKSLVNARPPVGVLTIAGTWTLENGKLVEDVQIDGNFMMKKMAKGNVERTHPGRHSMLFAQVV